MEQIIPDEKIIDVAFIAYTVSGGQFAGAAKAGNDEGEKENKSSVKIKSMIRILGMLFFMLFAVSKADAQTTLVRKGTMKVRKNPVKQAPLIKPDIVNWESYGADRTKKDSIQRARLDKIRKRKDKPVQKDTVIKTGVNAQ
ncbi:MAG: hypothetical protein ACJ75J_07940 [Cytophagaceae bacterium]